MRGRLAKRFGFLVHAAALSLLAATSNAQELPVKTVSVKDRPKPEYTAPGVNLGAFRLSPALALGFIRNDNLYATDSGAFGDSIGSIDLSANLQSQSAVFPLSLRGAVSSIRHSEAKAEDGVEWNAGAGLVLRNAGRTRVDLDVDISRLRESRSDTSFPGRAVEPPPYHVASGKVSATHAFASGDMQLSADFRDTDFNDARISDDDFLDQDFRDRATRSYEARLEMGIAHSIGALARLVRVEEDYRLDADARGIDHSSITHALYGGAAFNITNLMSGELGVGALWLDNRDESQADATSLALSSQVELYLTQLLTATLNLQRASGASDLAGSASYIATAFSAGLDYELRRNLVLSASASTSRREYTGVERAETGRNAALRAEWLINRRMSIDLGYSFIHRKSTTLGTARNFDQRLFETRLRLAL